MGGAELAENPFFRAHPGLKVTKKYFDLRNLRNLESRGGILVESMNTE
jgi:hypothetical protein